MKRTTLAVGLVMAMAIPMSGCRTASVNTPPAALVPGALNTFDSTTYTALASLHAFVDSLNLQITAGTFTPTPAEKALLNQMITDLDAAQVLYASYHSGATTQAVMQTALTKVQNDQNAYNSSVTAGAK